MFSTNLHLTIIMYLGIALEIYDNNDQQLNRLYLVIWTLYLKIRITALNDFVLPSAIE